LPVWLCDRPEPLARDPCGSSRAARAAGGGAGCGPSSGWAVLAVAGASVASPGAAGAFVAAPGVVTVGVAGAGAGVGVAGVGGVAIITRGETGAAGRTTPLGRGWERTSAPAAQMAVTAAKPP